MKKFSTLFYSILLAGTAAAQIPNASFESWTHSSGGGGYDTPDQWANPNPYLTAIPGVTYSVQKGSPGIAGSYYAKLVSQTVTGIGVVPGLVGTGTATLIGTSVNISGGFAFTSRPSTLTGEWQYAIAGTDTGHVIVYLFKWNPGTSSEDTVAFVDRPITGTQASWTAFTISLAYYSGATPDSARIVLSSGKLPPGTGTAGSSLYVDTLAFAGTVPAGIVTIKHNAAPTVIYPNPATHNTSIFYYSVEGGSVTMTFFDMSGRKMKDLHFIATTGSNDFTANVSDLPPGIYAVNIADAIGGVEERKLVVQ